MPSISYDISDFVEGYLREYIKDMPGNAGQEALIRDLYINPYARINIRIAGRDIDVNAEAYPTIYSSHPEAIEIILQDMEGALEEFLERLSDGGDIVGEMDLIKTIQSDYIDKAFEDLF